jgi:prolyl oligopeptidase
VDTVWDERFGVRMADPYRWLETDSAERRDWLTAQAAYATDHLTALPDRAALVDRVTELMAAATPLSGFAAAGGQVFCLRHGSGLPVLVVRDATAGDGAERVLLDPATLPGAVHSGIDWYVPSPDGTRVACGISPGGSEDSTLHVLDVPTATLGPEAIPGTFHGAVSWLPDGSGFVHHRYRRPAPDTPPDREREHSGSYLHVLGTDPADDLLVLGKDVNAAVPMAARDRPFVLLPAGSDWLLAVVSHSALAGSPTELVSACTLYAAPRAALTDPAGCPWRRLAEPADGVTAYAVHGDTAYLVSDRGAPRSAVLAVSLTSPDLAAATVVVPGGERAVVSVTVVGEHLLVRDVLAGVHGLRRVPLAGGVPVDVPLPVEGTIQEWAGHPDGRSAVLVLSSWTRSPRAYRYDPATGELADTGWLPPSPVDFGDLAVTELLVPAMDGTAIPLSVLHHKNLVRDGSHRTLLVGYGSYGLLLRREFTPHLLAWLERGGVYAVAGLRGGGEYGREWHEAGRHANKHRTITDFVDCADHLVAAGYTRPGLLAGDGTSAGGIPTGGALVRRPELWGAMVMQVPVTNATRVEFSANGPINTPEFGSVTTEQGLRDLLVVDAYLRVADGTRYPAVLLTAGLNDRRLAVWQPAKLAARLLAASTSGRPVLLRVESAGGHGRGATLAQRAALTADRYAFLLAELR